MLPIHEITNSLPPPRDDEPSSLRQDIVDEILDHLQCGMRRELLLNGGDEALSKQRVLGNFGDPSEIARKLWFQAMWSKIMTQRLVVGGAIFSMVISAVLVGMVGWMMQQQQRVNAAMLDQMAKLATQPSDAQPQRDLRWNNLKAKLTLGTKDGPAAEGHRINVTRKPGIGEDAKNGADFATKIDQSGVADCGYVEPGIYELVVSTPWNERTQVSFTVFPGMDHVEHVVVPEKMTETTNVSFDVEALQKGLKGTGLALVINFVPTGSRDIVGRTWRTWDWAKGVSRPLLLIVPRHGAWMASVADGAWIENDSSLQWGILHDGRNEKWEKLQSSAEFSVPANRYRMRFDILKVIENPKHSGIWQVAPASGFGLSEPDGWANGWHLFPTESHPMEVVAEIGKLNNWSMSVPDQVKSLRDHMKQLNERPDEHSY